MDSGDATDPCPCFSLQLPSRKKKGLVLAGTTGQQQWNIITLLDSLEDLSVADLRRKGFPPRAGQPVEVLPKPPSDP